MYGDLIIFYVLLSGLLEDFNVKGCDIVVKVIKLLNILLVLYYFIVNVKFCENVEEVRKVLFSEGIDFR